MLDLTRVPRLVRDLARFDAARAGKRTQDMCAACGQSMVTASVYHLEGHEYCTAMCAVDGPTQKAA